MYKDKFISALITAAGSGQRMQAEKPKLELNLLGKPIINYTLEKFVDLNIFDEILLITSEALIDEYKNRFSRYESVKTILGGQSREESTYNGLKSLSPLSDIVVCHDGARPLVKKETILSSIDSAIEFGSGVAGVKVKDTIKLVNNKLVEITPNREKLYAIQTPQAFSSHLILQAYNNFYKKIKATDDSSYLEAMDKDVYIVNGSYDNIKITTKEDLVYAKMLMEDLCE